MSKRKIQLKRTNYEIFIVILTILSWLNLLLYIFYQNQEIDAIIRQVEIFLTFIFLVDFLFRLRSASSAKVYFVKQYGWLDLIGSFPGLRVFRVYRVYKTMQLMGSFGSRRIIKEFITNRAESAVLTVTLAVILLFEFASIAILRAEAGANGANIITASDAIWWVLVTVATVGYGDLYPITERGRFVAIFVIVAGVGLFGILSGFLASNFLGKDASSVKYAGIGDDAPEDLSQILAELKKIRHEQVQARDILEKDRTEREFANEQIANRLALLQQLFEGSED